MPRDGQAYKRFSDTVDGPLLVLAILWLPVLIIPLAVHTAPTLATSLDAIDYFVWAIFVVEYIVKLSLAPNRARFVRTHLVDLLVIAVPFLRPLRLARVLRLLRLGRVVSVLGNVLRRARSIMTHNGLHFVLLSVLLIVFAAAALELGFENHQPGSNIHTFSDAIWWAMVTVTTVGYGDRFPVTSAGRGVAVVLMLIGIGLVGVVTATVASYFVEQRQDHNTAELDGRLERIERMLVALSTAAHLPIEMTALPAQMTSNVPGPAPGHPTVRDQVPQATRRSDTTTVGTRPGRTDRRPDHVRQAP